MHKDNMETIAATQRSLARKIIFLSLSGFCLAILAVAFDYRDNTFLLRSRSICQARNANTGTLSKNTADSTPAAMPASLGLAAVFPLTIEVVQEHATLFISSQVAYIYPNKAPPVRS